MTSEEIMNYIDEKKKDILNDLNGFIAIPSISDNEEEVKNALIYAVELGKKLGFRTKTVCNNQIGILEIGEGDETLGILVHVDVVPPGKEENWDIPPFEMRVKDKKIYGRGTMDDKGPIVVCLYAMKSLIDSGELMHKKVQMIIGTQEEVSWTDMDSYRKAGYPLPDYGFTPDGEFPLCNIEKGILDADMIFDLAEDFKKTGWYLKDIDAGIMINAIPGEAKALLNYYKSGRVMESKELKSKGKAVHSSQPEKGDNALFSLLKVVEKEDLIENQMLRILNMLNDKFGSFFGKELGLYSDSDWYNGEFVHRNAFSVNLFKVNEGKIKIHINCRFAYGTEPQEIEDALRRVAEEYGGELFNVESLPAVYISKERPFIKEFAAAYEIASERKNEFVLAYGGSYAKAMPNIVSWGPIFPGEEDKCHEDNEYINCESLMTSGKIFAIALHKIVMSQRHFK